MSIAFSNTGNIALSGGLEHYLQSIRRIPILTVAQEQELAKDFYDNGNVAAARKLTLAHLRFVAHVARGYAGYGMPQSDLIQEGNMGLMKAVKRFNPYKGVRLGSFAVHWIKAAIHDYVLKNFRMAKVATTKAQRKLFFNLRNLKKNFKTLTQLEVENIATSLDVASKDVRIMEERLSTNDCAFDLQESDNNHTDENNYAPASYLEDTRFNPEVLLEQEQSDSNTTTHLREALKTLDKRSQDIINKRWFGNIKFTLHDLALEYGISAERVRQIEGVAFKKIRGYLSGDYH